MGGDDGVFDFDSQEPSGIGKVTSNQPAWLNAKPAALGKGPILPMAEPKSTILAEARVRKRPSKLLPQNQEVILVLLFLAECQTKITIFAHIFIYLVHTIFLLSGGLLSLHGHSFPQISGLSL